VEDREPSPTRPEWFKMKAAEREYLAEENRLKEIHPFSVAEEKKPRDIRDEEWQFLKTAQREAREGFFAEGRDQFRLLSREIHNEVRTEFAPAWTEYFEAKRGGTLTPEELKFQKDWIVAHQEKLIAERRDESFQALLAERKSEYRELLDGQIEARAELRERQELGLRTYAERESRPDSALLASLHVAEPVNDNDHRATQEFRGVAQFREAASEVCLPESAASVSRQSDDDTREAEGPLHVFRMKDTTNSAADAAGGLINALSSIAEGILDGMSGTAEHRPPSDAPRPEKPAPPQQWEKVRDNPFLQVAEAARQAAIEQEQADRNRAWWEERDRGRGWD
jgi:hypothetical protein